MRSGQIFFTTARDSWRWIWWDVPARLVPLTLIPLLFLWITRTPAAQLGVTEAHLARDLALAVPCCLIGFAVAAAYADYLAGRVHRFLVPDRLDLWVQSAYYVVLNAPIEEWFFRGFLQGTLIRWWHAPVLGFLAATAVFGAYHFLGRWGWRWVLGATVAGFALGLLYLWQPNPPSILLPVLVHAAITCGFLSLGPFLMFAWRRSRGRVHPQVEAARPVL